MDEGTEKHQIQTLRSEHATLERLIAEENSRPCPDDIAIGQMKRRKLHIKDKLTQLERNTVMV
jgi:hypothetical protein